MRLPNEALHKVEKARIEVFYANRFMAKFWSERRGRNELRFYSGWYWYLKSRSGKAATGEHGPFRSRMSAYKNAFENMQMQLD